MDERISARGGTFEHPVAAPCATEYRNEDGEITLDEAEADGWTEAGLEVDFRDGPDADWKPWNYEEGFDYTTNRYLPGYPKPGGGGQGPEAGAPSAADAIIERHVWPTAAGGWRAGPGGSDAWGTRQEAVAELRRLLRRGHLQISGDCIVLAEPCGSGQGREEG